MWLFLGILFFVAGLMHPVNRVIHGGIVDNNTRHSQVGGGPNDGGEQIP